MSRITGSEARGMIEAYNAIYASQEVIEDQIAAEQVEEVVEDVEQLDEMGQRMTTGQTTAKPSTFKPTPGAGSAGGSGSGGRRGTPGASPGRLQMPASKPAAPAPAAPRPTAASPAPRPTAAAPAARPAAAPAPKPAAPKVSPTKPAPKGDAMSQWRANFPKLASKVTPSGERAGTQMGTGQSTMSKQAAELRAMRERLSSKQSVAQEEYDAFDLVLEYLIDNGHVETVDEALYVMLEMEAEVIQDIVEAKYGTKEGRHKLAMKRVKGEEIGKSGPGTGFKAVEKQAKKYGARDPKAVAAAAMYKTYGK